MTAALDLDLDTAARALEASPDHRVLHRFVPRERYCDAPTPNDTRLALYVDCETTSLDAETGKIIELALVEFLYDPRGTVYGLGDVYVGLEDPGTPLSAETIALTGITDADVAGQRLDEAQIEAMVAGAALVIAHHADLDRRFFEKRLPAFAAKPWACSQVEVDWTAYGVHGAKLVHVASEACRVFYDGHRALIDAQVGLHVLATAQRDGRTALAELLESARKPTLRVFASGSPFDAKDKLKARGYRWNATGKVWWIDVAPEALDAEKVWVNDEAWGRPVVRTLTAKERYSVRSDP